MRWLDPRLTYKNLKEIYYLNAIPFDVVQKIWVPDMSMPNALQAEGTLVDRGALIMILKDGKRMKDDLSIAREAKVYRGTECPIVYQKEYFIRFSCIFDLQMYPFDSNICTLQFEVSGINKDYIQLLIDTQYGGLKIIKYYKSKCLSFLLVIFVQFFMTKEQLMVSTLFRLLQRYPILLLDPTIPNPRVTEK